MAGRGNGRHTAQQPYSYPVYLLSYLPLTIFFIMMDAVPGYIYTKVQKGLKVTLIHT